MSTRREFLYGATAAATAAVTLLRSRSGHGAVPRSGKVDAVLFDERYSDSRKFARELARGGAQTFSVQFDVGRLWYGPWAQLFATPGVRLAGLTLHSDLFISTEFARHQRAAVMFQCMHDCRGSDAQTHTIERGTLRYAEPLSALSSGFWSIALAQRMTESRHDEDGDSAHIIAHSPRTHDHPGVLYSWVMAS